MHTCGICHTRGPAPLIHARENMNRTGEHFDYFTCEQCGCLQIEKPPQDMAAYYGDGYYSFSNTKRKALSQFRRNIRFRIINDLPTWLNTGIQGDRLAVRRGGVKRDQDILDVGCGSGDLISSLKDIGFKSVMGADPFIAADIQRPNGVRVLKVQLSKVEGQFDVIMFHHSLEHIWDQHGLLRAAHQRLKPGGQLIVRVPTVDSDAYRRYGLDWVQLDAPRHFFLHSRRSLADMIVAHGFEVDAVVDDSTDFQTLGSQKIARGIALNDPGTGSADFRRYFSTRKIAEAKRKARTLNALAEGDQICIHAFKRRDGDEAQTG